MKQWTLCAICGATPTAQAGKSETDCAGLAACREFYGEEWAAKIVVRLTTCRNKTDKCGGDDCEYCRKYEEAKQ